MPRTLIVGYGNPLRGDDGLGWHAAARLQDAVRDPDIEILAVHQLTPELMAPVSRADRVIFIDAAAAGEPGTISVAVLEAAGAASAFTHNASPSALLAGARALYGALPTAVLVSVAGLDFGVGEVLSEPVRRALEALVRSEIPRLLWGRTHPPCGG